MKNDPYFKFTAAIVLAGVLAAFVSPSAPTAQLPAATPPTVHAVTRAPLAVSAKSDADSPLAPTAVKRHEHRHAMQKS